MRAVALAADRASPAGADGDFDACPATPPAVADARAQGRLILIAEDDEVNQKVLLRQIDVLGYAAEVASNGAEALQIGRVLSRA